MADFLTVFNNSGYNVGSTPSTPVAEQNQTYFAYFNGVGGTGPEYIDRTGYFIKYLIDINGNVVSPEPYTETTSIEAVYLHNLKNNFEPGKRATVKLIEPNPTLDIIPNSEILTGTHTIAHVGRIVPILVTETGENVQDYITTMSFGPLLSRTTDPVGNVSARRFYVNNNPGYFFANATNFTDIPFNSATNLGANNTAWTVSGATIIAQSSSIEARTRIKFTVRLYIDGRDMEDVTNNPITIRVVRNNTEVIFSPPSVNINKFDNGYFGGFGSTWDSSYFDFETGDQFKVQYKVVSSNPNAQFKIVGFDTDVDYVSDTSFNITQETPASPGGTVDVEPINGVNAIYAFPSSSISASYCFISDDPTQGYSHVVFPSSSRLIYDSGLIQNLDSASSTFGFSPINIPFGDTGPGDFIRFEYNKEQVYTIVDVIEDYPFSGISEPGTLAFKVVPNIGSTQGTNTNIQRTGHFVIYRVLNDGVYVTLDVKKDAPGGAYTGLLLPEFISQELSEKLETLIQDLTQKEIIQ
jgi:hypothetical protein